MRTEELTLNFWNLAKAWRRGKNPRFRMSLETMLQQPYLTDRLRAAIQKAIAA